MPRYGPPVGGDRFAGLRQRRRERGLPTGPVATTQEIGDSLISQGFTAEPDPDDPDAVIFRPPADEAGGMSTSDGLGS